MKRTVRLLRLFGWLSTCLCLLTSNIAAQSNLEECPKIRGGCLQPGLTRSVLDTCQWTYTDKNNKKRSFRLTEDQKQQITQNDKISTSKPLSMGEVACFAHKAGFDGKSLAQAIAVAYGESGLDQTCVNPNEDGSIDYGLWQINNYGGRLSFLCDKAFPFLDEIKEMRTNCDAVGKEGSKIVLRSAVECALDMSTPSCAAHYAYERWKRNGWKPWSAYKPGDLKSSYTTKYYDARIFLESQAAQTIIQSEGCKGPHTAASHTGRNIAIAIGVPVAIVGALAPTALNSNNSNSSSNGMCDGLSSTNACGPCSSAAQCGSGGCFTITGSTRLAPFCAGPGQPD